MTISRDIGDRSYIGSLLYNWGFVYASLGQLERANEYLKQGLAVSKEIGERRLEGNHLSSLGNVALKQARYQEAQQYFHDALQISVDTELIPLTLLALVGIARLQSQRGNIDEALRLLSLVRHHPNAVGDVKQQTESFLAELKDKLPMDKVDTGLEQGKKLNLETVIAEILH